MSLAANLFVWFFEGVAPVGTESNPFQPFYIVGDIDGDGLGCLSWWDAEEEEEMDEAA